MTVSGLIEHLQNMDPEATVRLAIQPSWPFEHEVGRVVEAYDQDPDSDDAENVVFIGEGHQVGYLSGWARDEMSS